jgi:orotidine-5'-phosphate decarboxylase
MIPVHTESEGLLPFEPFVERLNKKIKATRSILCVGIDPPLSNYGPFLDEQRRVLGPRSFLEKFAYFIVEAATKKVPAVKIQSAYFEAYGSEGFAALETVLRHSKQRGLLTILDAKRGDISSTMEAYGHMAFQTLNADALTVTPYMGLEVIDPLWPWLKVGKGVYVVWISSNSSGALIQEKVASPLLKAVKCAMDTKNCPNSVGLVLGATKIDQLTDDLLEQATHLPLLMPGVGAQGGKINDRILKLKNQGFPILIPQSRSLMEKGLQAENWEAFRQAIDDQIRIEAEFLKI